MKVYVDELPENCAEWNCPFNYDICRCRYKEFVDVGDREIEYDYEKGRPKNCPLQSLTDYTKQVRKEVVQELKDKMLYCSERFADGCHYYNGEELDEIVDQIEQGETDAKD